MKAIQTTTETNNFQEVTVSTALAGNVIETIIFFNGIEIWQTNKVQDATKQHELAVKVAESYNLYYGGEYGLKEPLFGYKISKPINIIQ